jgi:hypothetical protein
VIVKVVLKDVSNQINIPCANVILSSSHSPQGVPTKEALGSSYSYQQFFTPTKDPVGINCASASSLSQLLYRNKNFCIGGSVPEYKMLQHGLCTGIRKPQLGIEHTMPC